MGFALQDNWRALRVMNVETKERFGREVVHVIGRDASGERVHLEVMNHDPSLLIPKSEYNVRIDAHYAVSHCEHGYKDMYGNPLVRVYANKSDSIPTLRELFDQTYEADVWFQHRFLLDKDVYAVIEFNQSKADSGVDGDYEIDTAHIRAGDNLKVEPRVLTVDIEVVSDEGFPTPKNAEWPVVSIVAHDSYTDEYTSFILRSPEWNEDPDFSDLRGDIEVFDSEHMMLNAFNYFVADMQPDVLSGWYSNGFDWPYLINRCSSLAVTSYREISPLGDVWVSRRWGDPAAKGITFVDMLDVFKKLSRHKLRDDKLDTVASEVLGRGKLDMTELEGAPKSKDKIFGWAWRNEPYTFLDYNIRDTEAVVQIDEAKSIISTLTHMQSVTGALIGDMIGNNINMIDMFVLHKAHEADIYLPTSQKPDEDWYFGAYVFTPKAGLHQHVVYPDLASLYPNMMAQCNMSPETLVGTQAELFMSPYSEEDCVWSYVDARPVARVQSGEDYSQYKNGDYKAVMRQKNDGSWETKWSDDPQYTKMYYLKHEKKQGFVSGLINDLLDMKYEYKGTELYDAVKAVVNSIYGVFGDSNSFGRGFRLFDWRMAESICLGGRKVIQHSETVFRDTLNAVHKPQDARDAYLVGGDTDSVMTSIPFAENGAQAYEMAQNAAAHVNGDYQVFCAETFGVSKEQNRMEIEVESYSPRCFFAQDKDKPKGVASKKRYVTEITIEDGEVLDEPKRNIKGFEAIRSDTSKLTVEAQKHVFDLLMHESVEDAEELAIEYLRGEVQKVRDGTYGADMIGVPFGISKELHKYGSDARKPMPWYCGAKYANKFIYKSDLIGPRMDGKPIYVYVDQVNFPLPRQYVSDSKEDGEPVECIALADASDMPESVNIDREKMINKQLERPFAPIFLTMGWDWQDVVNQ